MARLPEVNGDSGNWGTVLNEFLSVSLASDGTLKIPYLPIAGGTLTGNLVVSASLLPNRLTSSTSQMLFGDVSNKKNFLVNFDTIPDFPTDGITEDANRLRLAGIYFNQVRSSWYMGRVNHYNNYANYLGQYASQGGWSCQAVDPTGDAEGDQAKGQTLFGYGNLGGGPFSVGLGMYNSLLNTGFSIGRYNILGGTLNEVVVHNWTSTTAATSFEVSGDKTGTFSAGTLVATHITASGLTSSTVVNQVLSSSYSGATSRTTVNLRSPLEYQTATTSTAYLDSDNIRHVGWISLFGSGAQNTVALGDWNQTRASSSFILGMNNLTLGSRQVALGKQAVAKSNGECAFSTGYLYDGTSPRVSQESKWTVKRKTTDATANTPLTIDGNAPSTYTNQIVMEEGSVYQLDIQVAVIRANGNEAGGFTFNATVHRDNSGNITILGQSTPTSRLTAGISSASVVLGLDTTNKAIQVQVTGVSSVSLYWTAVVKAAVAMFTVPINQL